MNGPESRCHFSLCSGMELHHPIMSKLWDIGGRTKIRRKYMPLLISNFSYSAIRPGDPNSRLYILSDGITPVDFTSMCQFESIQGIVMISNLQFNISGVQK